MMAREIAWDGGNKWCGDGGEPRLFPKLHALHQCGGFSKGRRIARSDCGRFTCSKCHKTKPWCHGSADELAPTWCDDCWCEKYGTVEACGKGE